MQICNDADLGTEYSFPQNQNITGKAPRLLPCSSIASCPDQGSDLITRHRRGKKKNILTTSGIICSCATES